MDGRSFLRSGFYREKSLESSSFRFREPAQLPFSVGEASSPAISRTGKRLA